MQPCLLHHETRERLPAQIAVLANDDFAWFARYGLAIQARNVLDDGTKQSRNLWYEETLPPDAVLYAIRHGAGDCLLGRRYQLLIERHPHPLAAGHEIQHPFLAPVPVIAQNEALHADLHAFRLVCPTLHVRAFAALVIDRNDASIVRRDPPFYGRAFPRRCRWSRPTRLAPTPGMPDADSRRTRLPSVPAPGAVPHPEPETAVRLAVVTRELRSARHDHQPAAAARMG